jgi:hypothetical protein
MENYDMVAAIGFLLWAVNMLLPVVLGIITGLVYFWSRGKVNLSLASRYQSFKWREDKDLWLKGYPTSWLVMFIMVEGILGFIVTALLVKAGIPITIASVTLLSLLYLPRFIIDLTKGLKMNHKSGDLEEINSLKKRLEQSEKGE